MRRCYFKENEYLYGQDFSQFKGIPPYIIFEVDDDNIFKRDREYLMLKAPGYGKEPYGNGQISVSQNVLKLKKCIWITGSREGSAG